MLDSQQLVIFKGGGLFLNGFLKLFHECLQATDIVQSVFKQMMNNQVQKLSEVLRSGSHLA